jgi:arylsulfatase A-like enzyme
VPFLARWPGRIKAGVESAHLGYFGDMMATFAELAGGRPPAALDSLSLVPALVERIGAIMRDAHVDNEHWKWPAPTAPSPRAAGPGTPHSP